MTKKVFVLKIDDDYSQIFVGAVISDNPMIAMNTLLEEVKAETNNEADLRNVELLSFNLQAA